MKNPNETIEERSEGVADRNDPVCANDSSMPELCSGMMCLSTPDEISRLIGAGYGHFLRALSVTMLGINTREQNIEKRRVWTAQIMMNDSGCAFSRGGRCILSEVGLTPRMGVLYGRDDAEGMKKRIYEVVEAWADEDNAEAICHCLVTILNLSEENNNHTN